MKSWLHRTRRWLARFDPQAAVGGHWEGMGRLQLDFLVDEGLRPHHFLLDVACGSFRGDRHFIQNLDEGHYAGIDKNPTLLEEGRKRSLKPPSLLERKPKLHQVGFRGQPQDLGTLLKQSYDYIWVHALFDHMPPATIRVCLRNLANVLKASGRLYATIFLNPHGATFREPIIHPRKGSLTGAVVTYPDREYWHHPLEFFTDALKEIPQLDLDACLYDYPHPLGLRVLRFRRGSA